jgi:hypothetical protein
MAGILDERAAGGQTILRIELVVRASPPALTPLSIRWTIPARNFSLAERLNAESHNV